MIAAPHLVFLSMCAVAALAMWALDLRDMSFPRMFTGAVVMGLACGALLNAWTP